MSGEQILQVENLSKIFKTRKGFISRRKSEVRAVDRVSFSLHQGETLGLVGETGSGKSTIGRLVLRLLEPTAGKLWFDGEDISHISKSRARRLRRNLQMVFQDPYGSLDPRMKVASIIAEPLIVHGLWNSDGPQRVTQIMQSVGLEGQFGDRYPHEFSGGQRQRIGIARAMGLQPRLLVLDEPVSALDVSIQAQILNLLRELQEQANLGFLFIAHDLAVVRHVSDRIAVMYLGKIVEIGPRDDLYESPLHPYTVSLLSAVPVPERAKAGRRQRVMLHGEIASATEMPTGCRFHTRCYKARWLARQSNADTVELDGLRVPRRCVEDDPDLIELQGTHAAACHFPEVEGARSDDFRHAMSTINSNL